jgi:undecaprenyl-diphosphatase
MQLKWKLVGLGIFTLILSAISVLYWDQALMVWLKQVEIGRFYRIYRTLTDAGEAVYYISISAIVVGGAYFALRFFPRITEQNQKHLRTWKERSSFLLASLLSSGLILQIFKMIFGRQRPHVTDDFQAHVFHPFNLNWHFHSMPSGHSQTLLTVATACWIVFPKSGILVFPLAFFLACTRLAMQAHFLSDVMIGAYLGFAVTLLVAKKMKRL